MNRTIVALSSAVAAVLGSAAHASEALAGAPLQAAVAAAPSAAPAPPAAAAPLEAAARAAAQAAPPAGDDADDGEADAPDEPAIEQEVKAESAELEQMRAAEEKAHVAESPVPEDPAARAAARLGLESPLRQRLRDAFGREAGPGPDSAGRIALLPELDHDLRHLQAEYDIPIDVNEQVRDYIRFFQAPTVRKHFVKWLGRSERYIPTFRRILREAGLPEDTVYLAMIESGFANLATSRARAVGPWQFMPATGKRMGLHQDFWVDERRDPEKAARAAAKYLKELYGQTGDWRLAWAGYNAGVGKIFKAQRRGQQDFWAMTRGKVLKRETKGYVPKLMAAAIISKHPEDFGFTREEIEAEQWTLYDEVEVARATPLKAIAEASEVQEKALLDLNPELRRTCTPPRAYRIKIPQGQAEAFARNWPAVSEASGSLAFTQHRVGRGESIRSIAKAYNVDQASIVRMNGLRPGRHVKPGTDLVIPMNAAARSQGVAFASAEPPEPERSSASRRGSHREVRAARRVAAEPTGRVRSTVQVRSGDTLWNIAQRFGVAVDELCRWNGIRNPRHHKLLIGSEIVVYRRHEASARTRPLAQRG